MAKLPGWLLMVVGAIVVGYTKYIEAKRDASLGLFFWVGIILIAFGAFREVSARLFRPKKEEQKASPPEKKEVPTDHRHPAGHEFHGQSPHDTHQHTRPAQHPSHPHEVARKYCPRCHNTNVGHANFCHACGQRF